MRVHQHNNNRLCSITICWALTLLFDTYSSSLIHLLWRFKIQLHIHLHLHSKSPLDQIRSHLFLSIKLTNIFISSGNFALNRLILMKVRLVKFRLYESAENYLPFQLFLHHTNKSLNMSEKLVSSAGPDRKKILKSLSSLTC